MYKFEEARKQHVTEHGSFLYCPRRSVLCSFMEDEWKTGNTCDRKPCILDDPEHQKLQKRIEENRRLNEERRRDAPEEEEPRRIYIRQNKYQEDLIMDKINRLEKESREAYQRNRPKIGERKLHEAILLRRKLRREYNRKDV